MGSSQVSSRVRISLIGVMLLVAAGCGADVQDQPVDPDEREWIQLFNGTDLSGWSIKFTGQELGVNLRNTFRVEDGPLQVRYDEWESFDGEFGHIFYERPFSHYIVAAEYRFVGEQVTAGPNWAIRNNGLMLHSQSAESMGVDQDFPISIEVQLLGGLGEGERSTANLCTPGTNVVYEGELWTAHCRNSTSSTYHGDEWVRVEVMVLGDSIMKHIVNGDTVMTYTQPQIGGGSVSGHDPAVKEDGKLLTSGYIALQAETAPIDFRRVEVLELIGCTDPTALNYKSYFVASDDESCTYAN